MILYDLVYDHQSESLILRENHTHPKSFLRIAHSFGQFLSVPLDCQSTKIYNDSNDIIGICWSTWWREFVKSYSTLQSLEYPKNLPRTSESCNSLVKGFELFSLCMPLSLFPPTLYTVLKRLLADFASMLHKKSEQCLRPRKNASLKRFLHMSKATQQNNLFVISWEIWTREYLSRSQLLR